MRDLEIDRRIQGSWEGEVKHDSQLLSGSTKGIVIHIYKDREKGGTGLEGKK